MIQASEARAIAGHTNTINSSELQKIMDRFEGIIKKDAERGCVSTELNLRKAIAEYTTHPVSYDSVIRALSLEFTSAGFTFSRAFKNSEDKIKIKW